MPTFLAILLSVVLAAWASAADKTAVVQDFEQNFEVNKWGDAPGEVAFSSDWKADGKRSLRIDAGLMTAMETLSLKDWSGYTHLRMHFNNPGTQTVPIGFELQDQHTHFHERHQNGFGIQPGESVIEFSFTGGLWRGEENKPYRGKIKTPIDVSRITRVSLTNNGASSVFVDRIEVVAVPPITCAGGFAFDFAKRGAQVMGQFIGIDQGRRYDAASGYGLLANGIGPFLNPMSFPTPMLGAGFALPEEGFQVDLQGGKYIGLIAYERGGFWDGERSGYDKASLMLDGTVVHEHSFSSAGQFFEFQDTEVTDSAQIVDKLIWPAHAVHQFSFTAKSGANVFRLQTMKPVYLPLRIAGLILAPDNADGQAFMKAHIDLQRKAIATTFAIQDRGRRGPDRAAPTKDLQWQVMTPGEQGSPRDWPRTNVAETLPPLYAVAGQRLAIQLACFARAPITVTASGGELNGPSKLSAPSIAHGRYLPNRPYGTGAIWLEIHHFRPEATFTVGPDLSRAVVIDYDIPAGTKPGAYSGTVMMKAGKISVPVAITMTIVDAALPAIPIPVGMFMNAAPFPKADMGDEKTWWTIQESLLREQCRAGLTAVSGGEDLGFTLSGNTFTDTGARRYLTLAKQLGATTAVAYGGFMPGGRYFTGDWNALAAAAKAVEAELGVQQYCNMYDEPGTEEEKQRVLKNLATATATGLKTVGWTSMHAGDALWEQMTKQTYAPALNIHTADDIKRMKAAGQHPWTYNNGSDRVGFGILLWQQIQHGMEGRMEWIGNFVQGFAFHNLDGREPADSKFHIHREFGMLPTPGWLAAREGLLDLRIRLALEAAVPADDAALKAWSLDEGYRDAAVWTNERLQAARITMLKRLATAKRQ